MGSFVIGQSVAFAPDYDKAIAAARRVFQLLQRQSLIDASDVDGGIKLVDTICFCFRLPGGNPLFFA